MKAYTKGITKKQFVDEMKLHYKLDNFIKGTYGHGSEKGCAVGCGIASINKLGPDRLHLDRSEHINYEEYLGIPEWLALLEDTIFEGLDVKESKKWPVKFAEAINEGADLDKVKAPFIIYVLKNNIETLKGNTYTGTKDIIKITNSIIKLYKTNNQDNDMRVKVAEAARAARAAARAARAAAEAAWAAEVGEAARASSREEAFSKYADYLLKLLKECK